MTRKFRVGIVATLLLVSIISIVLLPQPQNAVITTAMVVESKSLIKLSDHTDYIIRCNGTDYSVSYSEYNSHDIGDVITYKDSTVIFDDIYSNVMLVASMLLIILLIDLLYYLIQTISKKCKKPKLQRINS